MNYWLFSIMFDNLPVTWPRMVEMGVAAQHYPPGWNNETKNLRHLLRLKRGDRIIAALHKHRFAGYGTLTSNFYRGGPSLKIHGRNGVYEFQERFNCRWLVLPLDAEPKFVELHDLKQNGLDIDLTIGLCVRQIDKTRYEAIKERLDMAGVEPQMAASSVPRIFASDIKRPPDRVGVTISRIIRDTLRTHELKKQYNFVCQVCGLQLKVDEDFYYAEVHHIRPLGGTHRGLDDESNMLVLCPNHHALFDLGVPRFLKNGIIAIGLKEHKLILSHKIDRENLEYHNNEIYSRGRKQY